MASIISLQDMGWPVSARTLAAASSALSVLLSAPASLALLDLAFLGLFDVAMTGLPFSWGLRISGSADIACPPGQDELPPVHAEIQAIPAEISQISTSSFLAQESPGFSQAGLEVSALVRLSDSVGWQFRVLRERGNVCR